MIVTDDNEISIYTNGSCLPNPKCVSFGIRYIFPSSFVLANSKIDFNSISFSNATNKSMELLAVIFLQAFFILNKPLFAGEKEFIPRSPTKSEGLGTACPS